MDSEKLVHDLKWKFSKSYRDKVRNEEKLRQQKQDEEREKAHQEKLKDNKERQEKVQEIEEIFEKAKPHIYPSQLGAWEKRKERAVNAARYHNKSLADADILFAKAIIANSEENNFEEVENNLRLSAEIRNQFDFDGLGNQFDPLFSLKEVCHHFLNYSKNNNNIEKVGDLLVLYEKERLEKDDYDVPYFKEYDQKVLKNAPEEIEKFKQRNLQVLPEMAEQRAEKFKEACSEGLKFVHPDSADDWKNLTDDILAEIQTEKGMLRANELILLSKALEEQSKGKPENEIEHILVEANKQVNQNYFGTMYHVDGEFSAMDKFLKFSQNGVPIYKKMVIDRIVDDLKTCDMVVEKTVANNKANPHMVVSMEVNASKLEDQLKHAEAQVQSIEKRNRSSTHQNIEEQNPTH